MSIGAVGVAVGVPPLATLLAYLVGIVLPVAASLGWIDDRLRGRGDLVGRALLALAVVGVLADRHLLVYSRVLVPDDIAAALAVAAILLLPSSPRGRAVAAGSAVAAYVLVAGTLIAAFPYGSDAVVATHGGAELILSGRDPYAEFDMPRELARFGLPPEYATGLEDGSRLRSLNYPALAVLAPAPFLALGLGDVRALYLVEVLILFALVYVAVAPELRLFALAALLGNIVVLDQFVVAGVDPLWALLLAAAWLARRSVWSAVLIGLAVADRQPAWLIAPFVLMAAAHAFGPREALRRTAIAVGVAVAVQVPFLLHAREAFVRGVTDIVVLPLEPHGIGPAGVGLGGPIPRGVFLVAFIATYALLFWMFATRRARGRGGVFVLPLASLWLAWRALQGYFALIPVLALLDRGDHR